MQVEHPCPQCGGPVILEETDRFLMCEFCRARLYIISNGFLRYYLPPLTKKIEETIFIPYWRFRGMYFSIRAFNIKNKMIDTSFLSGEHTFLPPSMGFRTQVLKMKFATPTIKTDFIQAQSSFDDVLSKAEIVSNFFGAYSGAIFHRAFIGETISMIYAPIYIKNNKIVDGILDKAIGSVTSSVEAQLEHRDTNENWGVQFAPALCPDCGWDLNGERDSLVLFCKNCDTAWHVEADQFNKVKLKVAPSQLQNEIYLPFWSVTVEVEGLQLKSYADFVKIANLPKVIRPEWHDQTLRFWSPAFKANPKIYLRLCGQITVVQPDINDHPETLPKSSICPVTVDTQEAFESVKVTLANAVSSKNKLFPKLPDIRIKPKKAVLALIPFRLRGSELIQSEMNFSILKRSIHGLQL